MKTKRLFTSLFIGITLLLGSVPTFATSLTNYGENTLADHMFRGTAYSATTPTSYYVALYTAACSDSAAGTEVTGGSYARVAIARSQAAWNGTQGSAGAASTGINGTISNAAAITYPAATADWGLVTHWGIIDTSTGAGNLIICEQLTASRTISTGSTPSYAIGALTIQVDN